MWWLRMLIVLAGIVLTINGCNSLISQFFGTHKLRQMQLSEAETQGLGDADFVALTDLVVPGDYVIGRALHDTDQPIAIFPLLTPAQYADYQAGRQTAPRVLAWTKVEEDCIGRGDCIQAGGTTIRGLVRSPNPRKDASAGLAEANFRIPDDIYFLEAYRAPLAWYWNLLMVIVGIGLAVGVEARAARRRRQTTNTNDANEF